MQIGFVFAMQEEAASFINYLTQISSKLNNNMASHQKINNKLHRFSFCHPSIFFKKILGLKQNQKIDIFIAISGIGKVNAAIAAASLIQKYQLQLLINIGTAGALSQELKVADLVLIQKFIYNDVDATTFNYDYGQVPKMPKIYTLDKILNQKLTTFFIDNQVQVKIANLGTGDTFLTTKNSKILNKIKNITCDVIDMEGTAYAQTACVFNCPFVSFKIVSDYVISKTNSLDYQQNLKLCSKKIKALAALIFSE